MNALRMLVVGLVAGVSALVAAVSTPVPQNDQELAKKVIHEIRMYPYYSIWDDIQVRVDNGSVALLGDVNQPYKKSDLQKIVQHTPGVTSVADQLNVLPLSPFDNQIRARVARAIYRDPFLSRYGLQIVPPIHIIVDNGHVRLEGVVATDTEKNVAGIRANGAGLSFGRVINNLRVENPSPKKA